jgi:hypothetical protein
LRIEQVAFEPPAAEALVAAGLQAVPARLVLRWHGAAGQSFAVESSEDLRRWSQVQAAVDEPAPGSYVGRCDGSPAKQRFFRIRQLARP